MKMTHQDWQIFKYVAGVMITDKVMDVPSDKVRYFKENGWHEVELVVEEKKDTKAIKCKYCGKEFTSSGQLLAHYKHCERK